MNRALQWKLVAGFILVFVAGGITGALVGASHTRSRIFGPHRGMPSEHMRRWIRHELNLTPEQVAKISPVIDKASAQLESIRRETGKRVHETMEQAHQEMAVNLTDEQRAKLHEIEARHAHRRGLHQPPPPGPPDQEEPDSQ
jgi:Spy/CpxP family protein refolding chaperone